MSLRNHHKKEKLKTAMGGIGGKKKIRIANGFHQNSIEKN